MTKDNPCLLFLSITRPSKHWIGFPASFVLSGGQVYLTADYGGTGLEIWKTNGTDSGTTLVRDILPGSRSSSPKNFVELDGFIYFNANGGSRTGLYRTDGTAENTTLVADTGGGGFGLTKFGSAIFFRGLDSELWISNGTAEGTLLFKDIRPGSPGSDPTSLTDVNGVLYFSADDGSGFELWKSDGTQVGTIKVKDINPGAGVSSRPASFVQFGSFVYFRATDAATGTELWRTDGTEQGTSLVADINPGVNSSSPNNFTVFGSWLYFISTGGLRRTNGSITELVTDFSPGNVPWNATPLTVVGNRMVLRTSNGLWATDGTTNGTFQVYSLPAGFNLTNVTTIENQLYFTATNGNFRNPSLWKTDGTLPGTIQLDAKGNDYSITSIVPTPTGVAFRASRFPTQNQAISEIWKVDNGGAQRLEIVANTPADTQSASTLINGNWIYAQSDGLNGSELWISRLTDPKPENLAIDSNFISENLAVTTTVGGFSVPTVGSHNYSLVNGLGSDDNVAFTIDGNLLKSAVVFDYEAKPVYKIRVRATGSGGFVERTFLITVINVNEAPVAVTDQFATASNSGFLEFKPTINDFDPDRERVDIASVSSPIYGTAFVGSGNDRIFYRPLPGYVGPDSFTYTVHDFEGLISTATINISVLDNALVVDSRSTSLGADLQAAVTVASNAAAPTQVILNADTVTMASLVSAVRSTTATSPVRVVLNANRGDYQGLDLFTTNNIQLVLTGNITVTGHSPALVVQGGQIEIADGPVLTNNTDAPTILVLDGKLKIRNATIEETSGGDQAAIEIVGGSVDLGTTQSPGGNVFVTRGPGLFVNNKTTTHFPAFNNSFSIDASVASESETNQRILDGADDNTKGFVDRAIPISQVNPLPSLSANSSLSVSWSGLDIGSGIASFDLFVSDNEGAFTPWLVKTNQTTATFQGQPGHSYKFYSLAFDRSGLAELPPAIADAQTQTQIAPTDIVISNNSVDENLNTDAVVGVLSSVDSNASDTHTYSLVPGVGDSGNGAFEIVGNTLKTKATFDFETTPSYSIRVRTTDSGGLSFERSFTINVNNTFATRAWDGDAGDSLWNNPLNWQGDILPDADSLVTIGPAFASTVITSTENVTVHAIVGDASLSITSGELKLQAPSDLNNEMIIAGGSLVAVGPVNVDELTLISGVLSGSGTVTVSNNLTWTSGFMTGTGKTIIASGATATLTPTNDYLNLTRTLENAGQITLVGSASGHNLALGNSSSAGTINNLVGGVFTFGNRAVISEDFGHSAASAFNNAGTIVRNGSSASAVSVPLNNSGSIDVQIGTLSFNGGGHFTGISTFTGDVGFGGGTFTQNSGASIAGSGGIAIVEGSSTLAGSWTIPNLKITNGELLATGTIAVANLSITSDGLLSGSGTVTVGNSLTWTEGTMTGTGKTTIASGATATLTPTNYYLGLTRTLENAGQITLSSTSGFNLALGNSSSAGTINNLVGGVFTFGNRAVISEDFGHSAASAFNNAGTIVRNGSSASSVSVPLNNSGSIDVQIGTLAFNGGGHFTGISTFTGDVGFGGGTFTQNSGASIVGSGGIAVVEGSSTLGGSWTIPNLKITNGGVLFGTGTIAAANLSISSGGVLSGSGTVTISNGLTWTSGSMTGTGKTIIASGATATLTPTNDYLNLARTLENAGQVTLSSTSGLNLALGNSSSAGTINNLVGGVFTFGNRAVIGEDFGHNAASAFNNAGTIVRNGSSASSVSVPLNNSGSIDVQIGTLAFNGGGHFTGISTFTGDVGFGGGTFTQDSSASIVGSGGIAVVEGSSTLGGSWTIPNLKITNGGVLFGTGTIAAANLSISSGGVLSGSGTVTISNGLTWTSGSMTGTGKTIIATGATATLTPTNDYLNLARTLENAGQVTLVGSVSGHNLALGNSSSAGTINNLVGGVFTFGNRAVISEDFGHSAASAFNNAGTIVRNGSSASSVSVPLNNSGSIDVQIGTLAFNGGGHFTGISTFTGDVGFGGGTFTQNSGASIVGSGGIAVVEGSSTLGGRWTIPNLKITNGGVLFGTGTIAAANLSISSGGVLSGSGTVTISNGLTWTSGSMTGTGKTIIASGATATLTPTNDYLNLARTLENAGQVTLSSTSGLNLALGNSSSAGTINNLVGGVFTFGNRAVISEDFGHNAASAFNNAGTIVRNGSSASSVSVPLNNSGSIDIQLGSLDFSASGDLLFSNQTFLRSSLTGSVSISGSLIGNTANATQFAPAGNLVFTHPSATWETMSQDRGASVTGFDRNFAFRSVQLSANVTLVNNADNAAGANAEAIYVDTLTIDSGVTLDLNSLHVYASRLINNGTAVNGTVSLVTEPGILVLPNTGLVTDETARTAVFTVVLTSQPSGTVTIPLSISDSSEGSLSVSSLTFTSDNWDIPQQVTVTGIDDTLLDPAVSYRVVLSPVISGDQNYNGIDPANVFLVNLDNESIASAQPPTASDLSVTTNEDVATDVMLTASDPNGDPLTFSIVTTPAHGVLSGTAPNLIYTPFQDYFGSDSFTYIANDGRLNSNVATVTLTVTAINDAPQVANPIADRVVAESAASFDINLGNVFADVDDVVFTFATSSSNPGLVNATVVNGVATVTMANAKNGLATITVTATDSGNLSVSDEFSITVLNSLPTLVVSSALDGYSGVTGQDRVLRLTVTDATDNGARPFTYEILWGDGSPLETISGPSVVDASHAYATTGSKTVQVRTIDPDGGASELVTRTLNILRTEAQGNVLAIGGNSGDDVLAFTPGASAPAAQVLLNAVSLGAINVPTGGIKFFGGSGNDTLIMNGTAGNDAFNTDGASMVWNGSATWPLGVRLDSAGVEKLRVQAQAGNDEIIIASGAAEVDGGTGTDRITGPNSGGLWNVTGAGIGTLNGLSFLGIETVLGGSGTDNFVFGAAGAFTGIVDGNGGQDTLNFSAKTTAVTISLLANTATSTGGIRNIEQFVGGTAADTFFAPNTANAWQLTGQKSGLLNLTIEFSGFETLKGGTSTDNFEVVPAASSFASVDGGTGSDSLNYSAFSTSIQVDLASKSAPGITSFVGFESLIGSSANDLLVGPNSVNAWTVNGLNTGALGTTLFQSFESIQGGTGNDTVILTATGGLTGSVDGATGTDTLIGPSLAGVNVDWTITSTGSGAVYSVSFLGVENLTGGTSVDRFLMTDSGSIAGTINGGSSPLGQRDQLNYAAVTTPISINLAANVSTNVGLLSGIEEVLGTTGDTDAIRGANVANAWSITGADTGIVGSMRFVDIENLTGGTFADSFSLVTGGSVRGTIVGGDGADTLVGPTPGVGSVIDWNITTAGGGDVLGVDFAEFENLTGGNNLDRFTFSETGSVTGTINGGSSGVGERDQLNYSSTTGPIVVDLAAKLQPRAGLLVGVEEIIGTSSSQDAILGANAANTWSITGLDTGTVGSLRFVGVENLTGGTLADSFTLANGGSVRGLLTGGDGTDTLVGPTPGAGSVIDWNITTAGGGDVLGNDFAEFENLTGGSNLDRFIFSETGSVTGTINGGANAVTERDQLNYASTTGPITVDLAARLQPRAGLLVGIEEIVGTSSAEDEIRGANAANAWSLTGTDTGTVGSLRFVDIENLTGGILADSFSLVAGGSVRGAIRGGAGVDTLLGANTNNVWQVQGENTGLINAMAYQEIENLSGGSATDTFVIGSSGSVSGVLNAGAGTADRLDYSVQSSILIVNLQTRSLSGGGTFTGVEQIAGSFSGGDLLIGPDVTTAWSLSGVNTGTAGAIQFSGFESVQGGSANDTFTLGTAGAMAGVVIGGGGTDTLVGPSPGLGSMTEWNINSAGGGNLRDVDFEGIENLTGGNNLDRFLFSASGAVTGTINGGASGVGERDQVSYAAVTGPIMIDLQAKTQPRATSLVGIEELVGTDASDDLRGLDAANTWSLTGANTGTVGTFRFVGFENLRGGTLADTFSFVAGGTAASVDGGAGIDTILGPNAVTTWDLQSAGQGTIGTSSFVAIENLTGGTAVDTFNIGPSGSLAGALNGGTTGRNVLSYAAWSSPVTVNLSTKVASAITGQVTNFTIVQGGSGNDQLTGNSTLGTILLGMDGNDALVGVSGRDIMIGGFGGDTLTGGAGDDLLIAGATVYDNDFVSLSSIFDELSNTSRNYLTRVNNLRGIGTEPRLNGNLFLQNSPTRTLYADPGSVDQLIGGLGQDWFITDDIEDATDQVLSGPLAELRDEVDAPPA